MAACDSDEAFVHDFDSLDELRAALSGAWTFCRGGFRDDAVGIELADDGTYRHLDATGATVATGRYVLHDTSVVNGPGATQVNLTDDDTAADYVMSWPLLADAPLKLWVGDGIRSVLSAMP